VTLRSNTGVICVEMMCSFLRVGALVRLFNCRNSGGG